MTLPSKELLSEVLGEQYIHVVLDGTTIVAYKGLFQHSYIDGKEINIYELMHLCKEWAVEQKIVHDIDTYYDGASVSIEVVGECKQSGESGCVLYSSIKADEVTATFDYCEWVLDNEH